MSVKVYVSASSQERQRARCCLDHVRESPELELTHDWLIVMEETEADGAPTPAHLQNCAQNDLEGVTEADVFWLLLPESPSVGAWVELGWALAIRSMHEQVRIITSGPGNQNLFTLLSDVHFETDLEALEFIKTFARDLEPAGTPAQRDAVASLEARFLAEERERREIHEDLMEGFAKPLIFGGLVDLEDDQ